MPTVIAENVIEPDVYFEHADPALWGGKVLRTSAGVDVLERAAGNEKSVRIMPAGWQQTVAEQGQVVVIVENGNASDSGASMVPASNVPAEGRIVDGRRWRG